MDYTGCTNCEDLMTEITALVGTINRMVDASKAGQVVRNELLAIVQDVADSDVALHSLSERARALIAKV